MSGVVAELQICDVAKLTPIQLKELFKWLKEQRAKALKDWPEYGQLYTATLHKNDA